MVKLFIFVLLSGTAIGFSIIEPPNRISEYIHPNVPQYPKVQQDVGHIVGGRKADKGEYPWLIRLMYNDNFICGGTILDEKTILTAAHCVVDKKDNILSGDFSIKAGDYKTYATEATEQVKRVKKIIKHKMYNKRSLIDRDVAILKLADPLELNQYVQTIALPDKAQEKALLSSPKCFVAGIGDTDFPNGNIAVKTQEVRVSMLSRKNCLKKTRIYEPLFTSYMLCSLDTETGACSGDSGGPLTCFDKNETPFQVGIVSWGDQNCWTGLNVFTRVSNLKSWIKKA